MAWAVTTLVVVTPSQAGFVMMLPGAVLVTWADAGTMLAPVPNRRASDRLYVPAPVPTLLTVTS